MAIDIAKEIDRVQRMGNIEKHIFDAFNRADVQADFIDRIHEQLQLGIDSEGTAMRTIAAPSGEVYSLYTIELKKGKNQPTDKMTLYDDGDFYSSMKMRISLGSFDVIANFQKEDGNIRDNLYDDYDVLSLTAENLERFAYEVLLPEIEHAINVLYSE